MAAMAGHADTVVATVFLLLLLGKVVVPHCAVAQAAGRSLWDLEVAFGFELVVDLCGFVLYVDLFGFVLFAGLFVDPRECRVPP